MSLLAEHVDLPLDMLARYKLCTLDILCGWSSRKAALPVCLTEVAMGAELTSQLNPEHPYCRAVTELATVIAELDLKPLNWTRVGRWLTGMGKRHDDAVKAAHDFTNAVNIPHTLPVHSLGMFLSRCWKLERRASQTEKWSLTRGSSSMFSFKREKQRS